MILPRADNNKREMQPSATSANSAYVYVLRCGDGSLYTGWTDDLSRRLQAHSSGKASKYTRSRLPVRLAAWFTLSDASSARSLEARFKRLTRRQKLAALAAREAFGIAMHKARPL
jgi:putative endonuclease